MPRPRAATALLELPQIAGETGLIVANVRPLMRSKVELRPRVAAVVHRVIGLRRNQDLFNTVLAHVPDPVAELEHAVARTIRSLPEAELIPLDIAPRPTAAVWIFPPELCRALIGDQRVEPPHVVSLYVSALCLADLQEVRQSLLAHVMVDGDIEPFRCGELQTGFLTITFVASHQMVNARRSSVGNGNHCQWER